MVNFRKEDAFTVNQFTIKRGSKKGDLQRDRDEDTGEQSCYTRIKFSDHLSQRPDVLVHKYSLVNDKGAYRFCR